MLVNSGATSLMLCPDRTSQPHGPANFALGSASSQLQEVLVTDLPRSFNRGERERNQRGRRERERDEREEGRERGRIEKDRFFNFHCST